jgi:hypothetical protein
MNRFAADIAPKADRNRPEQAQEAVKALVATDVAITQKAVLTLRYRFDNKFERLQVLLLGCQNRVAR